MDFEDFENDFLAYTIMENDMVEFKRLLPTIMPHYLYYFACCEFGRLEMLQMLPPHYTELSTNDQNLLHYACQFGHHDIVCFLLQVEPQLCFHADSNGDYPFNCACESGNFTIAKELLVRYPDLLNIPLSEPNSIGSCLNSLLLHPIDQTGLDIVSHIVTTKPEYVNIPRYQQYPIFQLFCIDHTFHFRLQLLKLFLDHNCLLTRKDGNGKSVLHYAIKLNNALITCELIKKGLDINEQDFDGNTPLHDYYYAVANQHFIEREFAFIEATINWNSVNKNGDTIHFLKNRAISMNCSIGRKRRNDDMDTSNKTFKDYFYSILSNVSFVFAIKL